MPGLPPGRIPARNPQLSKVQEVTMSIKPIPAVTAPLGVQQQVQGYGEIAAQKLHLFAADKKLLGLVEAVNPE